MAREYQQYCGVARALDLVGERWTLLIVRDLLLGPRRFSELQTALGGIPPAVLSRRLRRLVDQGLVTAAGPSRDDGYALTDEGLRLKTSILELGRFGSAYMTDGPRIEDRVNMRWGVVSLMRRYDATRIPPGRQWQLVVRCEDQAWLINIGPQGLVVSDLVEPDWHGIDSSDGDLERVGSSAPDAVVVCTQAGIKALLLGLSSPEELLTTGDVRCRGRRQAFVDLVLSIH